MIKIPIGVAWRNGFVRCTSDSFNKAYFIQEMKRSRNNIVPVVVLDEQTKKAKTLLINSSMTDFDVINDPILQRRIEGIGTYMINRTHVQKSKMSNEDKEKLIKLLASKYYRQEDLTSKQEKELEKGLKMVNNG